MLGAADIGIGTFVEAKELIGRARYSDADGFADGSGGKAGNAEPKRAAAAKIDAIMAAVNLQSCGEAAGAAGEIEEASGIAMLLHELDALERFEGANEDRRSCAGRLADDV